MGVCLPPTARGTALKLGVTHGVGVWLRVWGVGKPRWELSTFPDDPAQAPTQKELADRLHSAPPTIAASLKALERQGYVERRTDQRDTRRNRVAITRKGRDALAQGMGAQELVEQQAGSLVHGGTLQSFAR